jgi:hypothetical protein
MKERDLPLAFPCGRDFRSMQRAEGGRLCTECQTVVRDLSSMCEAEARAVLEGGAASRLCVRYLYDASGRIVFADEKDLAQARIVPAFNLTRRAKARIAQAALLAAPLVLFEACGGAYPDPPKQNWQQADPSVGDAGDAGSGDDGGPGGDAARADGGNAGGDDAADDSDSSGRD